MTTIYLIRHSLKFDNTRIKNYNTLQSELIKSEKIILSVEGEKRAERLSDLEELQNIDKVYVSNCVRTLQTAKYLVEKQDLDVTIDERFDERRLGFRNDDIYPNWFELQYNDENFKTLLGESQKEVTKRFEEAINEIIEKDKGKRIAVFAHGYSITFFLMKWLKLIKIDNKKFTFKYKNKIIFDKEIDAPEIFKISFREDGKVIDISTIECEVIK